MRSSEFIPYGYLTYEADSDVDFYKFLGISRSAPIGEIKRTLNIMYKATYPHNGGDRSMFEMVLEIRDMLLHPINKKIYDITGFRKKDIQELAQDFGISIANVYSAGHKDEATIKKILKEALSEKEVEIKKKLKENNDKLDTYKKLLDEVEAENMMMSMLFNHFERGVKELSSNKLIIEHELKINDAKIYLASLLNMKTKRIQQFVYGNSTTNMNPASFNPPGSQFFSFRV